MHRRADDSARDLLPARGDVGLSNTVSQDSRADDETLPHSVSLYYDFTGAIDNIYASLVSKLMVGEKVSAKAVFCPDVSSLSSLVRASAASDRSGGRADSLTLTCSFLRSHRNLGGICSSGLSKNILREQGVDIREHQAIKCECGEEIRERIVQQRLRAGNKDVICPVCEKKTLISDVADKIRERDSDSDERILALRKRIEHETAVDAEMAKGMVAGKRPIETWKEKLTHLQEQEAIASDSSKLPHVGEHEIAEAEAERIKELSLVEMKRPEMEGLGNKRLLHLSDLHFTGETSVRQHLVPLLQDIRNGEHLGFDSVEYLVISGDMTDRGRCGRIRESP